MDDEVGNRFYPSDQQIILHYLEGKMNGLNFPNVIEEIDICRFEPRDLPGQAAWQSDDPVWYFFSERDYKYANSTRVNRKTKEGYWKPTGKDRPIRDKHGREIGSKKNLVFYQGRFNKGKQYVLCRLKRKANDDGSDTCDGPSHQMASQGNPQLSDLESLPHLSETDYDLLCETMSQMNQAAPGPSYSNGSNYEPNAWTWRSNINSPEQEKLWNLVWADAEGGADSFEESVNTPVHDFNPPESLRQVSADDSSYTNTEMAYSQWSNVLDTPSFLSGNASSAEYRQIHMVQAPQSKKPRINCIQLLSDGFPVETRISKSQHFPKSNIVEKKTAPEKLYLQGKVSNKATSRNEVRDDAKLAIDLPQKRNSIVKYIKGQGTAQSDGKTWSKMRSDGSNGSRKGYIIFLETPPFGLTQKPPSVFIGNILIAVVLLLFIIREMESLR
uniref:NAC transcription factor 69 n=1 Tax=Litchi chinensis TaxID=151069 RepID=A0A8K1HZQ0_LITCN|nr:NAC transcription factor 69 [Litchi chinensis]